MESQKRISELEDEIKRLRSVIAKMMADIGVPEKNYNEDIVFFDNGLDEWEYVPFRVAVLCTEYGMPWNIFYCEEHDNWIDEVGTSFPHCIEDMTCPLCRGEVDDEE